MPQKRIGRRVGIGLLVVACAVALATPLAVAHRTVAHAPPARGNVASGFRVFNDYFCAACHVMKRPAPRRTAATTSATATRPAAPA